MHLRGTIRAFFILHHCVQHQDHVTITQRIDDPLVYPLVQDKDYVKDGDERETLPPRSGVYGRNGCIASEDFWWMQKMYQPTKDLGSPVEMSEFLTKDLKRTYYENNTFPGIWGVVSGLWCCHMHWIMSVHAFFEWAPTVSRWASQFRCGLLRRVREGTFEYYHPLPIPL